jgi:uncharacterized protein HemX
MDKKPTNTSKSFVPEVSTESSSSQHTVTKNASWGALISIAIILAMVIVGAFYAWGQRISEEHTLQTQTTSSS